MNRSYSPPARVIIVDFTEQLATMLDTLASCCEGSIFTSQEILMIALTHLHFSHQLNLAIETMMVETTTYCQFEADTRTVQRIESNVVKYLQELHALFHFYRLYDHDGELQYTLGGWVGEYTPYLIPRTAIPLFASAVNNRVVSEYDLPRPFREDMENRDHLFWKPRAI